MTTEKYKTGGGAYLFILLFFLIAFECAIRMSAHALIVFSSAIRVFTVFSIPVFVPPEDVSEKLH